MYPPLPVERSGTPEIPRGPTRTLHPRKQGRCPRRGHLSDDRCPRPAARNRGKDYGRYDFATRYLVQFAQLPAFRHLSPEVYQDRVAQLIREIEEEGVAKRDGNPVAGREKILQQNPYKPPHWFPDGTYPPALPFIGPRPPRRPPSPPTRRITVSESGDIERGEIPVVEISVSVGTVVASETDFALGVGEPRARGQPP